MLQHQIVQSPARRGLASPNSPSLQNPTPPTFPSSQQQQPSHSHPQQTPTAAAAPATPAATSTISPALLPLLPPLPRAQFLLLQMSSLASKLFDVSPNRSLWLSSFRGSLPTFLSSQNQSSSSAAPPLPPLLDSAPSSAKDIISLFTSLQTQLFEAVAELQEILDLQDSKQRLAREIKSKDSSLLNFANKLKDAERVLDILVDDYSDYRRPKRLKKSPAEGDEGETDNVDATQTTVNSRLKLSDILSYAHRISYTTFAPPEFGAGRAPLRGALPPAPQEEQLRASQLYNFADLDVGLPKRVETMGKTIEPIIEPLPPPPQPATEAHPLANLTSLLPPNITVPSGWKPGMPVELPMDLPVPPPGWKPGDPLPPLESLPVPRIVEQRLQPSAAPQGLTKAPETIQVRHVQLDILDQDDDSSDYSSDEGSSEDDD